MALSHDVLKRYLAEDLLYFNSTAEIRTVDDLRRRAVDFLRAMGSSESSGSLVWFALQQQSLIAEGSSELQTTAERVLQRVREESAEKEAAGLGDLYGPRGRSVPVPSEASVDLAMERLSAEDWNMLKSEFDVSRNEGFDVVERTEEENDVGHLCGADEAAPMRSDVPDGESRFFGAGPIEITFDAGMWPSAQLEDEESHDGSHKIVDFSSKPEVPAVVETKVAKPRQSEPTANPDQYIRERVRAILIANRVVDDLKDCTINHVLSVTSKMQQDEKEKVRELMKSQLAALCEAVALMQKLQETDRAAMKRYTDDPYRKQPWQRDEAVSACHHCQRSFTALVRHHHCRRCGLIFCHGCSSYFGKLPERNTHTLFASQWRRLCVNCYEKCCKHQRAGGKRSTAPPTNCERDTRTPENPSLTVLRCCPNPDMTLEDNLPPFYVILPEECYALKQVSPERCMSSMFNIPHLILEGLQDGASAFLGAAVPKVVEWTKGAASTVYSVEN